MWTRRFALYFLHVIRKTQFSWNRAYPWLLHVMLSSVVSLVQWNVGIMNTLYVTVKSSYEMALIFSQLFFFFFLYFFIIYQRNSFFHLTKLRNWISFTVSLIQHHDERYSHIYYCTLWKNLLFLKTLKS